jgi:hypothetical protein
MQEKSFNHSVNKGTFQEKNGKPEPMRVFQNFFLFVPKRVNFGKGLLNFFSPQSGGLQIDKRKIYSTGCEIIVSQHLIYVALTVQYFSF